MKEVGATWLVETVDYIKDNPQFIVNGFIKPGLSTAVKGVVEEDVSTDDGDEHESDDSDF